jgi:bifunctional DNase/RNase
LFKSFLDSFQIELEEVIIYNLVEGIFFAKVVCQQNGKSLEIDARSSDAVAIALRCEKPIYTHDFILGSAGIIIDEDDDDPDTEEIEDFSTGDLSSVSSGDDRSIEELENELDIALEREEYEKASRLRDEIQKRKKK